MKIQFIPSFGDLAWDEKFPVAKEEHRGKAARILTKEGRTLMLCLPCGHISTIDTWNIEGIDTNTPSATPSILCRGQDGKECWHGYLTKGELIGT